MRNSVLLLVIILFSGSCLKSDTGCQYKETTGAAPASEEQAVLNYLSTNGISATKHPSNMYYTIVEPGSGPSPGLCSQVVVTYTGKLTNGAVIDEQTNSVFMLGVLIEGWKKGLPLIKKGGKINLYIPPTLGYGNADFKDRNGNIVIPANSVLVFNISLTDFQ